MLSCLVLRCATHGLLGGFLKAPKEVKNSKTSGDPQTKSTVGSELPWVKVSRKSVRRSPMKIGPELY